MPSCLTSALTSLLAALLCACVRGELCKFARNRCVSRTGCGMALNSYWVSCGPLLHGHTTECSTKCKESLISLITANDHTSHDIMQCDCDGNQFCETSRRRLEVCTQDVLEIIQLVNDEHSVIGCSLAEMVCVADSACLKALEYYHENCRGMWRGDRCTAACYNSLTILHRLPQARKLRSCQCDGTEEYPVRCQVIKDNTERLCFEATTHHVRHNHKTHRHNRTHHDTSTTLRPPSHIPQVKKDPDIYNNQENPMNIPERNSSSTRTQLSQSCAVPVLITYILIQVLRLDS